MQEKWKEVYSQIAHGIANDFERIEMQEKWKEVYSQIAHGIANMMWGSATPERVALVEGWLISQHIPEALERLQNNKT